MGIRKTVLLFLFIIVLILISFSLYLRNSTPPFNAEPPSSEFDHAWVRFTTSGFLDFVVEDSLGNRTGYNPNTDTRYSEIPESGYGIEYPPGSRIDEGDGIKYFEAKAYGDYDFKITLYGDKEDTYFYDYSMATDDLDGHSAREVKTDLMFDPNKENVLNFSYDF